LYEPVKSARVASVMAQQSSRTLASLQEAVATPQAAAQVQLSKEHHLQPRREVRFTMILLFLLIALLVGVFVLDHQTGFLLKLNLANRLLGV